MVERSVNTVLAPEADSLTATAELVADFIPLLTTVFNDSTDSVGIYTVNHTLAYANQTLLKTLGCSMDEAHLSHPKLLSRLDSYQQALISTLNTGQSMTFLLECHPSTIQRPVHDLISMTAIKDQQEMIIGVIAIGRDLSDYRQTQYQELAQKERYQRALIDNFPFMVWLKDLDSRFLSINNAFAQLMGVTYPEEGIGKKDQDYFTPRFSEQCVASDQEVLLLGLPKIFIESVEDADGNLNWVEVYKSPVLVDDKVVGTVGFARDMSEIQKLYADVSKTKSDYVSLIKNLPLAIIRYNLNCQRVFLNDYCEHIFGEPAEPLIGKTPTEYWYAAATGMKAQEFEARLRMVMQTGQIDTFEFNCKLNGKEVVYLMRFVPEFDANKKVTGALALANDMTAVSEYRNQIEYMAYHDSLTNLPNRAKFNMRIANEIENAKHQQSCLDLLMIDLDHFKSVNDTLGHTVGDKLLVEAAERLVNTLQVGNSVARLGGDEFAVLVQGVQNIKDLGALAKDIVQALTVPFHIANQELYVTASIGIAIYPQDTKNEDDLLRYADVAMYAAKKQGRNNYQFFVPELNQHISQRLSLQTELMHAIEKNEFYLNYQPLVQLDTAEIIGVEALLRWRNPVLGEVNPNQFIPLAEELGVITEIGRWVMMQAFEDAVTINLNRQNPLIFAVNLSARQFLRYDIFAAVQYCLSVTACNPAWITLEITESLLLNDSNQVLDTLHQFVDLGIKVAIDDFGTGYSSLSYLNKFPISEVKIDRSFVNDITLDENDAKLVKAVIGMALSLGKELIAEGVETQEQADLLKSWGCNIGQGYLFSKPLSFEQLLLRLP
ncbi:MAG: diguanylate cyclase [Proteobacteria bacterium ST_bin12]|nr:MAG: diguanylate cyclase [Proteobacteria bacterium ST_bin12]